MRQVDATESLRPTRSMELDRPLRIKNDRRAGDELPTATPGNRSSAWSSARSGTGERIRARGKRSVESWQATGGEHGGRKKPVARNAVRGERRRKLDDPNRRRRYSSTMPTDDVTGTPQTRNGSSDDASESVGRRNERSVKRKREKQTASRRDVSGLHAGPIAAVDNETTARPARRFHRAGRE